MRRSFVATAVLAAVLLAVNGPAGAGNGPAGQMQAAPAPATTADDVVISNVGNADSTCEGGLVNLFVEDENFDTVFDDVIEPDGSGNWSQSLGMLPAGDYLAEADCDFDIQELSIGPAAQPFFHYADLEFTVTQVGTLPTDSVPSTTTTTAAPTTTAAAAATATPRFTG